MTKVSVTQNHINKGYRQNSGLCPVALAFIDVVKANVMVSVSTRNACLSYTDENKKFHSTSIYHGENMRILDFDRIGHMTPFDIEVDIPNKYLKEQL